MTNNASTVAWNAGRDREPPDSIRVLQVDDEPDFADMVATYLEQEHARMTVVTETSAERALERVDIDGAIDCIVSDYRMTDMDGLELLSAVRERAPSLPFILYTARGSEDVASRAIGAGVTDYVKKPRTTGEYAVLANRIERAVTSHRHERRAERLARINAVLRDVSQMAVRATTTDELFQAVCRRLAASEPYRSAWIGTPNSAGSGMVPRAWDGVEDGFFDGTTIAHSRASPNPCPAVRTIETGDTQVVQAIPDESACSPCPYRAIEASYGAAACVPLVYEDTDYGVLNLYAGLADAFEGSEQRILAEVGRTIGHAIHRIETHDVLEERNRELAESRERYRTLNATIPDALVVADADTGEITEVNDAAVDLTGRPRDELVGMHHLDIYASEARAAYRQLYEADEPERSVFRRLPDGTELHVETVDGGSVPVEINVNSVELDDRTLIQSVFRDITERREWERRIRAERAKYSTLVENSVDGIVIVRDGAFEFANQQAAAIFDATTEELLGQPFVDYFDPECREAVVDLCERRPAGGDAPRRYEVELHDSHRVVELSGSDIVYRDAEAVMVLVRDVTDRKRYDETLKALHGTTRDLLHTDTADEIADVVVETATDVLDLSSVALYRFDSDESVLRPLSYASALPDVGEPSPVLPGDGVLWEVFRTGETVVIDGNEDRPSWLAGGSAPILAAPVGDHGVLLAGAATTTGFTGRITDLADILKATTAAALDRIERDANLREREGELERQNTRLSRLNQLNDQLRSIGRLLVQAESRDEVERNACERLAAVDRFGFVWIGEVDPATETLQPREWAGDDGRYFDTVSLALDADSSAGEPATRTATTRDVTVVRNVGDAVHAEPWRQEALALGYRSVLSVPLHYNDVLYDTLTIYSTEQSAFSELDEDVLSEFGQAMAMKISSIERRNALVSDDWVDLEFEITDTNCVLRRLARDADCSLEMEDIIHQSDAARTIIVQVTAGDAEAAVSTAEHLTSVDGCRLVRDSPSGALLQLRLSWSFLAETVAEHGGSLKRLTATPEAVRAVVSLPASADVRSITEVIFEEYPDSELRSKRQHRETGPSPTADEPALLAQLTERQRESIELAYHAGYFEWPRDSTGEEVAEAIGVSPPTFHRHLRRVERKLFTNLLGDDPSSE